jgi:hypothetical protein
MAKTKLLQEIENTKKTKFFNNCSLVRKKMIMSVKIVLGVGYLFNIYASILA